MAFFFRAIGRSVARAVVSRSVSALTSRGIPRGVGNFGRNINIQTRSRSVARTALAVASSGRFGLVDELSEEIGELYEEASERVETAFYEAVDTMTGMCANEGQYSVIERYAIPEFAAQVGSTQLGEEWRDVDIGEYMAFVGEIVEAGNQIMSDAYSDAESLTDEADDIEAEIEGLEEEGIDPDEFF